MSKAEESPGETREYAGIARISGRFVRNGREEVVKEADEVVDPALLRGPVATVTRGYGLTLNLGNYESARFDVSLTMPCLPQDMDLCDEWCAAWVEKRVQAEVTQVRGSKESKEPKKKSGGAGVL